MHAPRDLVAATIISEINPAGVEERKSLKISLVISLVELF